MVKLMTNPTPSPALIAELQIEEGCKLLSYPDPRSALYRACQAHGLDPYTQYSVLAGWRGISGAPWTIGYGHAGNDVKPQMTWTQAQAHAQLLQDAQEAIDELVRLAPWVANVPFPRNEVLFDLAYNMGAEKLIKDWPHFMAYVQAGKYLSASMEITNNHVYVAEVGRRAAILANIMQSGHR